jgi:UDP-glucose 4-epimerase
MSKALVTGGAGFIGSNVARLLAEEGYDVVVLDNLSTGYRENLDGLKHVRLVEADVREASAVKQAAEGAEVIFHLAASVGNTRSIENPLDDSEINVLGTLHVLEAGRQTGVRKVDLWRAQTFAHP